MAFKQLSSPHAHGSNQTQRVMLTVALACLPGIVALTCFFGVGSILNIVLACVTALLCEALMLKLRGRPLGFYLSDGSALVTGVLLGIALPPYCAWWIVVVGSASAIVLAKHLYGGLGYNPFNPAMVAYVILLISFPVQMTQWAVPEALLSNDKNLPDLWTAVTHIWIAPGSNGYFDGYSGATPLDVLKQSDAMSWDALKEAEPILAQGRWAGLGWEWVNLGFLLGGLYLLYKKVFTWHAPVSMLASIVILSSVFYFSEENSGSPVFHLFSGATMLGAFFIATDPVSSAVSTRGRIVYGAGIGALVYIIRTWGNYPDAVAFAVLLMNIAAPFIDYYTLPRTYGHRKSRSATEKAVADQ